MTEDARFEDGAAQPLRIVAMDDDDVQVLSALAQDAVFPATEMQWQRKERRFGVLLNRFRWEDVRSPKTGGQTPERVQSVLSMDNVTRVASQGIDRTDADMVLSLLSITLEDEAVILTLAGDGAIRVDVDAVEITLRDVTRPYVAVSGKVPDHPE